MDCAKHKVEACAECEPSPKPKPAKFCWECGRKLRGKFTYQILFAGHWRTVHKYCGERHRAELREEGVGRD